MRRSSWFPVVLGEVLVLYLIGRWLTSLFPLSKVHRRMSKSVGMMKSLLYLPSYKNRCNSRHCLGTSNAK
jgi:hypothetical protein